MIKLSVIVPCYNVEKYLKACIDSILKAKIDDMEIILVNDGSKDNTLAICLDYEKKYPDLIKVIDKENGGLSDARNAGIAKAKGEYLAFIDSDDTINKNFIKDMVEKAYTGDFEMVTCGVKMIYKDHEVDVTPGYLEDLIGKEAIKAQMYDFYPAACNKIYKRALFKDLSFKKGVAYEDVEFMYRLLPNVNKIGVVDGFYYEYMQREGSITYTFNEKLYDMVNNFDSIFKYYKEHNLFDEYYEELEYVYVRYSLATFIKRMAKCKDKKKYLEAVDYALTKVKENFPDYKKNKYLKKSKKGLYLKYFNKMIASLIFQLEKNRQN